MAITCDYCGEFADGEATEVQYGNKFTPEGRVFDYCEECAVRVRAMLDDLADWAHGRKGSGYEWRLTPAPTAEVPASRKTTTRRKPTKKFDGIDLHPIPATALGRDGLQSLADIAERTELELMSIDGIGATTMRRLNAALEERGMSLTPGPTPEDLGAALRRLRETAGLTTEEVADRVDPPEPDGRGYTRKEIGVYRNLVSSWEGGSRIPSRLILGRLADIYGVEADALLRGEAV